MRQAGEASFYQLLDLPPTAAAQEVHEAYEQVARLVHPANAQRLGLAGREGVLEMLFERLTQAYLNLSQPDRRKAYDRELRPKAWAAASARAGPAPGGGARRGRALLQAGAGAGGRPTTSTSPSSCCSRRCAPIPRPEYYALLGKLQAKNPRWLRVRRGEPAAGHGAGLAGPGADAGAPRRGAASGWRPARARSSRPDHPDAARTGRSKGARGAGRRGPRSGRRVKRGAITIQCPRRRAPGGRFARPSGRRGEESPNSYGQQAR